MVFQAENELELLDWVRVFENAKSHALLKTTPALSASISSTTLSAPSSGVASVAITAEEKENLTFPIETIEEEPPSSLIEYPNKELEEFSKNRQDTLLLTAPFNYMDNITASIEEGGSRGGRMYVTDKEIILSEYDFSKEDGNETKIPWIQIKEIKIERENPAILYPKLVIKQNDQPDLTVTILAQGEDLKILEKIHIGVKRFASDPQDLLNRLYRVGGVSLEGGEGEGQIGESFKKTASLEGFDFEVPPEIGLPTAQVRPPPVDSVVYDVKELDTRINLPVQVLFQVLFANDHLTSLWHKKRKSRDLEIVPWTGLEIDGKRILKYIIL